MTSLSSPSADADTPSQSSKHVSLLSGSDLILEDRGLDELPRGVSLAYGPATKLLNLKENCLVSVDEIKHFQKLETLILDKNNLKGLSNFPLLATVKTLWFNNNNVRDLNQFCKDLVRCFPNLEYLSMLNNPCCPAFWDESISGADAYRRYRLMVIFWLPCLRFLDATPVTMEERKAAEKRGQFLGKTAKPSTKRPSAEQLRALQERAEAEKAYELEKASRKVTRRKSSTTMLGLGHADQRYDGSHSEGNRFITNGDL
jgi:hypothetical protein